MAVTAMNSFPWGTFIMVILVAVAATVMHVAVSSESSLPSLGNGFSQARVQLIFDATGFTILAVDLAILILTYINSHYFQTAYETKCVQKLGGRCGYCLQSLFFLISFLMTLACFCCLFVAISWYCFTFVFREFCNQDVPFSTDVLNSLPIIKDTAPNHEWTDEDVQEGCVKLKAWNDHGFWLKVCIALSLMAFAQIQIFAITSFNIGVYTQRVEAEDETPLQRTPRSDIGLTAFSSSKNSRGQGDTIGGHTIKYVDDDEDGI